MNSHGFIKEMLQLKRVQLKIALLTQKWCSTQSCWLINQSMSSLIPPLFTHTILVLSCFLKLKIKL